jgi:glycosyltransferase involved in cell wall biosynthesis
MPAYNEEGAIRSAVEEVKNEVLDKVPGATLLVVNDGSKDNTASILNELAGNDSRITVIHQVNRGHGPSLVRAMNEAKGKYIFQIDSDMQIPLNTFSQLWETIDATDAIFGVRLQRNDPAHRLYMSALIAFILGIIFKVDLPDSNAPFKIFRKQIWEELQAKLGEEKILAPSIFLAIYARTHKYKVMEVPVEHRARAIGNPSSLNVVSVAKIAINGFRQVIQYKDQLS